MNRLSPGRLVLRLLSVFGAVFMVAILARPAFAHDNVGGDELSMANAIFTAGMVALAGAAIALIWGIRAGQFNNVEEPKYAMLDNAPDLEDLPIFGRDPTVREATRAARRSAKAAAEQRATLVTGEESSRP